jgi:hypothetical protein
VAAHLLGGDDGVANVGVADVVPVTSAKVSIAATLIFGSDAVSFFIINEFAVILKNNNDLKDQVGIDCRQDNHL